MIWISARSKAASRIAAGAALLGASTLAIPFATVAWSDGGTIKTDNVRSAETDAGDLVADSIKTAMGADIGIAPAAAFKVSASAPKPANGDQAAGLVDPGSDTLSLLNLRGDQIMNALERSVSFEPQASSGFLQVAGLRYSYNVHKEGGKRISSVTVNGQPLDASKRYKVATTKPLAHGQQGYFQIWEKSDIANDSATTIDSAIKEYVKAKGGSISPSVDGRITSADK